MKTGLSYGLWRLPKARREGGFRHGGDSTARIACDRKKKPPEGRLCTFAQRHHFAALPGLRRLHILGEQFAHDLSPASLVLFCDVCRTLLIC